MRFRYVEVVGLRTYPRLTMRQLVVAVLVVCGLVVGNYFMCSLLTSVSLERLRHSQGADDQYLENSHQSHASEKKAELSLTHS